MNILATLRARFLPVLAPLTDDPEQLLDMIRPAQDARFGDYQANFAMPLGKKLGQPPRDVATQLVEQAQLDDFCEQPEVAGPGFINIKLRNHWLVAQLTAALADERLAIPRVSDPRTFVLDYSSPNVAKAMHVGHIRSTVIGDSLYRTLQFVGHRVISDNHLGDWGTQFGMIIYGYKHFADQEAFATSPVPELGRLYKLVHQLVEYHNATAQLPSSHKQLADKQSELKSAEAEGADAPKDKKRKKRLRDLRNQIADLTERCDSLQAKINQVQQDAALKQLAEQHANIASAVLDETAKLHADDPENLELWRRFLPHCKKDIQRIYERIDIRFDHELGESFYHDRLGKVVGDLETRGLARESDGATCVFFDEFETPMIVRKKDGAFLYATTDLATIQYRMETWRPDFILYVVDHRQSEHFDKLFACARLLGYEQVELRHISFGTVLGNDKRPYRTRSGDVVGLEGLLDEAIRRAHQVVAANDDAKPNGPELNDAERDNIARTVGHAALKYADLSHNRTSDYVFSYDKMVALEGNTATYMQYSYARIEGIFTKGNIDRSALQAAGGNILIGEAAERDLALELVQLGDTLEKTLEDFRPNVLTSYLYSLATKFSRFYQSCNVLKAESKELRDSRLLLCDLTGRTIALGLSLLGIGVVNKM